MNETEIEKYVRERAHQMFTEAPGLWNHQGIVRQYLRLAYLDGAAQLEEEKKVNQAIVDLLDEALQKVRYSEDVISGLTISGKIDFLVRAAQQADSHNASR